MPRSRSSRATATARRPRTTSRASATSKGGVYFHFPSKQALFLCLLDEAAQFLVERVERAMAVEADPIARGDAALRTVLQTFGGHRTLARLLLVEALGAGREFNAKLADLHAAFAGLVKRWLDSIGRVPTQRTTLYGQSPEERRHVSFDALPLQPVVQTKSQRCARTEHPMAVTR